MADIPYEKDVAQTQEYLVSRGVRPLALVGTCGNTEEEMLRVITKIEQFSTGDAIPFVFDRGDGVADYGFASHRWVIDLYGYAVKQDSPVPQEMRDCLVGLLLGYSTDAIERFRASSQSRVVTPERSILGGANQVPSNGAVGTARRESISLAQGDL